MPMEDPSEPIEILTVSDDSIVLEEQLNRKDEGWVISFTITAQVDRPVAVRIAVPMPSQDAPLDTGFHPRHEPHSWELSEGILTFEDTVPADEPLQILLGIVILDDHSADLTLAEPTIESSQTLDAAEEAEAIQPGTPIFRSSSIVSDEDFDFGGEPIEEGSVFDSSGGQEESPAMVGDSVEGAAFDGSVETDAPVDDGTAGFDESPEATDGAEDSSTDWIDPDKLQVASTDDAGASSAEEEDDGLDGEAGSIDDRAGGSGPSGDVLSTLLEQLEAADSDDDVVVKLREHLEVESPKSIDVRLQHIQSRMDNLSAYTEALEGFINEHGTASEVVTDIQSELDRLESQVNDVQDDVAAAEADRAEVRDGLNRVESSMDDLGEDLRTRIDNIYDDLDSIRVTVNDRESVVESIQESIDTHDAALDDHDNELETLDTRLEESRDNLTANLASLADEVDTLDDRFESHRVTTQDRLSDLAGEVEDLRQSYEADLDKLREEVDHLAEMRDIFARAFADEAPVQGSEEEPADAEPPSDPEPEAEPADEAGGDGVEDDSDE